MGRRREVCIRARLGGDVDLSAGAHTVFATNDIPHTDRDGGDHDRFDEPLARSLAAWMHGKQLDKPVHTWTRKAPPTTVHPDRVATALRDSPTEWGDTDRLLWLGDAVLELDDGLLLHHPGGPTALPVPGKLRTWVDQVLEQSPPS